MQNKRTVLLAILLVTALLIPAQAEQEPSNDERWDDGFGFGVGGATFERDKAIAIDGNKVYVGERFVTAGGNAVRRIARWFGPKPPIVDPPARVPVITNLAIRGKKLGVIGENFDPGALILVDGTSHKTANDALAPATTLIAKRLGKRVKSGDKLRVQNPDGKLSEEFTVQR